MTKKEAMQRLDQIDEQICKLMDEADRIKKSSETSSFDKEAFEKLINLYEESSIVVKNMFISYVIDTTDDINSMFL